MQRSAAARNMMGGRVYSIEGTGQDYHEDGRRIESRTEQALRMEICGCGDSGFYEGEGEQRKWLSGCSVSDNQFCNDDAR